MSCWSCWTHPPPFPIYPQPVSSHIAAAKSEEASHPAEYHGSPVSLSSMSACHLHVQHPTPPPIILFPHLLFHFPSVLLRWAKHAYRWPPEADPWLVDTAFITSPLFNPACPPSAYFLFPLHLIAHPTASWLWGHRLRQQQSRWKAWPYLPSRAHSALWDSGGRWRR